VVFPRGLIKATEYLERVEANLAEIADRPTLIVWGAKDFAFGERERTRFEASFPNHRTVVFDDASHFLQEDASDRIARAIKAFVEEVGR
jgi:haloalkane dehalogenase